MEDETKHLKGSMADIAEVAEADAARDRALSADADEDEHEIDVLEFGLDAQGIDEFITTLTQLKEQRESVSFAIDEDNDLIIHYEDESFDEPEDEETEEDAADEAAPLGGA